jgi:hypothetical protein
MPGILHIADQDLEQESNHSTVCGTAQAANLHRGAGGSQGAPARWIDKGRHDGLVQHSDAQIVPDYDFIKNRTKLVKNQPT